MGQEVLDFIEKPELLPTTPEDWFRLAVEYDVFLDKVP